MSHQLRKIREVAYSHLAFLFCDRFVSYMLIMHQLLLAGNVYFYVVALYNKSVKDVFWLLL